MFYTIWRAIGIISQHQTLFEKVLFLVVVGRQSTMSLFFGTWSESQNMDQNQINKANRDKRVAAKKFAGQRLAGDKPKGVSKFTKTTTKSQGKSPYNKTERPKKEREAPVYSGNEEETSE